MLGMAINERLKLYHSPGLEGDSVKGALPLFTTVLSEIPAYLNS